MGVKESESVMPEPPVRSISALLSQVLVAFTVEFDNEFERQMNEAGYPGARLSLVIWGSLMRFIPPGGISAHDLAAHADSAENRTKHELGCLERWGFVRLQPDPSTLPLEAARREGWGSGRGIREWWLVQLTSKGRTATQIWPPLFGVIEQRWEKRFGKSEINRLRKALQLDIELPRATSKGGSLPLPALLAQLLTTFRLEFDRESTTPLALCANTLRVLSEKPMRLADIPRLTGTSPETSDIGWQMKPYVIVEPDPGASRGQVVRLSPKGAKAQQTYYRLIGEIERRWEAKFGHDEVAQLRESLERTFDLGKENRPRISEGLLPPKGTVRAGDQAPALGRRDVGAAARQRMRDLVAQTQAFIDNPAATLPHYPVWDMNRGFGP